MNNIKSIIIAVSLIVFIAWFSATSYAICHVPNAVCDTYAEAVDKANSYCSWALSVCYCDCWYEDTGCRQGSVSGVLAIYLISGSEQDGHCTGQCGKKGSAGGIGYICTCADPCCDNSDPCCGSTDPCCGDPCCGDPCCGDPNCKPCP